MSSQDSSWRGRPPLSDSEDDERFDSSRDRGGRDDYRRGDFRHGDFRRDDYDRREHRYGRRDEYFHEEFRQRSRSPRRERAKSPPRSPQAWSPATRKDHRKSAVVELSYIVYDHHPEHP